MSLGNICPFLNDEFAFRCLHNCFFQLHVFFVYFGTSNTLAGVEAILLAHLDELDLAETTFAED